MLSAVAGIMDARGGLRVVVTQRWRMRYHLEKGERLFVVPGVQVQEPVPWDDIPALIETVQKHVVTTLAPVNDCGNCQACCFTLHIKDGPFQKASHSWCNNCAVGFGCKVYQQRPQVCRAFKCEWLKSQTKNDRMAPWLRPDRCGAIFTSDTTTNDPLIIECHGKPDANAWAWIEEMQSVGYKVREIVRYSGEKDK